MGYGTLRSTALLIATTLALSSCGDDSSTQSAGGDTGSSSESSLVISLTAASGDDENQAVVQIRDADGLPAAKSNGELLVQLSLSEDFSEHVEIATFARSDDAIAFDIHRARHLGDDGADHPIYLKVRRERDDTVSNRIVIRGNGRSTRDRIDNLLRRLRAALNFSTYQWTEVTARAPWDERAGLQAVQLRNRLYIMGGRTPIASPVPGASILWNDVWRSDDQGASWRALPQTDTTFRWPARAYFQAVTKSGRMYVLGGQDFNIVANPGCAQFPAGVPCNLPDVPASEFFNDVWSSRDGRHWTELTSDAGWAKRAGLSAAVFKNAIYVLGGSQNDDSAIVGGPPARIYYNDVWRSTDGVTWEQVTASAPWAPRAGAVAAVKDGYLWVLGGEDGFLCDPSRPDRCPPYFNDVWRTRDGANWEQVTAAAGWSARPGHQCVVLLNRFVCFGGFGIPPEGSFAANNPSDVWVSKNGRQWVQVSDNPWNATGPGDIKYDFDALAVYSRGRPSVITFGGDRETFDFQDPLNFMRVDNDVWRFAPAIGQR